MLRVKCISNKGYETQLKVGKQYEVLATGAGGFALVDEMGEKRFYRATKFKYDPAR